MPDKDNFGAVLQPVASTLGNRGLRSHTELDGHGAYIPQPVAFAQNQREEVREVDVPGALAAEPGTHQQTYVAQPVPYDLFQITAPVNRQNRAPGDPCHTLARDNAAHAAVVGTIDMQACKGNANVGDGSVSPTLCKPSGNDVHAVAFHQNQVGECFTSPVGFTVGTTGNASARNTSMAVVGTDCYNGAITGDVAATMGTPGSSCNASGPTVMSFPWQSALDPIGVPQNICGTLIKNQTMGVAHALRAEGFDASEDGTGRGTPLVPIAPTLTAHNDPSRSPQSAEVTQQVAAVHATTMTVRRLSPVECERLQGFPDDWTLIPWRKKPADECPDGPRYKALGNSMACNCMAFIGERIQAWEARNAS